METSDSNQSPETIRECEGNMIRPAFIAWRTATDSLLTMSKSTDEDTRDQVIERIEALLDEREKLQLEMVAPFTEEEQDFGKKLVELETDVQKGLDLFTTRIRTNISELQSKKVHMKSYMNPYGNVARDGRYYDTKQ